MLFTRRIEDSTIPGTCVRGRAVGPRRGRREMGLEELQTNSSVVGSSPGWMVLVQIEPAVSEVSAPQPV